MSTLLKLSTTTMLMFRERMIRMLLNMLPRMEPREPWTLSEPSNIFRATAMRVKAKQSTTPMIAMPQ